MNSKLIAIVGEYRTILATDGMVSKEELITMLKVDEAISKSINYEKLADLILKKIRKPPEKTKSRKDIDRMELYKQGLSDYEIASIVGVSQSTICNWRKKRNLPSNKTLRDNEGHKEKLELYNKGYKDEEIADKLNLTLQAIRDWRKKYKLDKNKKPPGLTDREHTEIRRLKMIEDGYTARQIADAEGVGIKAIHNWMRRRKTSV